MIKKNKLLLLLALLSAFPPLSTDMYLAAIPMLEKAWNQPLAVMNLTLVVFFISYCVCLLFYGPLSDRFGRRSLLLIGVGIFILGSLLCAGAGQVTQLIVARAIQACGAASASVLSLAITKDVYQGHERAHMLAYIGVIMALAPMLAPIIGGWVLLRFSWRWIFVIQALIAAVAWFGVFAMEETLKSRSSKGVLQTAGIYLNLLGNRRYMGFALMFSLVVMPHFAFIGGSASIYITGLGLSEQVFGYFFAINALAIMAGAFACTRLLSKVGERWLLTAGFAGIMLGGVILGGQDFHHRCSRDRCRGNDPVSLATCFQNSRYKTRL